MTEPIPLWPQAWAPPSAHEAISAYAVRLLQASIIALLVLAVFEASPLRAKQWRVLPDPGPTLIARPANCYDIISDEFGIKHSITYTIGYALAAKVDISKPPRAEDGRLREASSIPGFIKPGKLTVETAVAAQHLLKSPEVVPVPEKELGVTVDIGSQGLVKSDEVLVSAPRLTELARCRAVLQTLDRIDICLTVGIGVRVPFRANAGVGAGALPLLKLLKLFVQITGGDR